MRLTRLEIEDFELIARASLEFADGFTVCTGETGSGKTMLLGALGFVLGERSSPDSVRGGAARARVTLEIDLDEALRARLADAGLDDEGETAIFTREMQSSGKSTARINGNLVTSAQLREFGGLLLDRVGQHEHQRLLSRTYQMDALDAFAGGWAVFWNELLDGAPPGRHRAAATALTRGGETLTARTAVARWFDQFSPEDRRSEDRWPK